jgi:hypothetical protein
VPGDGDSYSAVVIDKSHPKGVETRHMERWQSFLNSLATKGGNLFVIVSFLSSLMLAVILLRKEPNNQAQTVILSQLTGFATALFAIMGVSGGNQRKTDANGNGTNGTTTTGTSTVSTQSTATTTKPAQ